jgi:hypothetical protein
MELEGLALDIYLMWDIKSFREAMTIKIYKFFIYQTGLVFVGEAEN